MKKILVLTLIILAASLAANQQMKTASDFQLSDAQGNLVRLSDFSDKLVLIDFWASWCAPCKKALEYWSTYQEKYADELVVLAINIDKPRHQPLAQAYVKSNDFAFISLYDPEQITLALYNVVNPPRAVLVAPGMQVVYTHDGYKRGDELDIEKQILKWINHQPLTQNSSPESKTNNFHINGMNKLKYVYRTAEDSLHHYLDNEFSFSADYNRFRFGMTYRGELPEYNRFAPDENLESSKIYRNWVERFAEFNGEHFYLRAGNYETVFGCGMVIHAYNNTDLNEDNRLDGAQAQVKYGNLQLQAIYGALPNENYPAMDDVVTGFDFSYYLMKPLNIGGSALSCRSYVNGSKYEYNQRDVFDGRLQFSTPVVELNAEFAASKKYRDVIPALEGSAIFANLNLYLGNLRLTSAFKDYENFNERLVDLPTVNHSEEPIAEYGQWSQPGYDEQGFQGILFWTPDDDQELEFNYAEGWAENDDVYQSDFYGSYKREFMDWALHLEYVQMERLDDSDEEYKWDKEIKPSLETDFLLQGKPMLWKVEWKRQRYDNYGNETDFSEPLIQVDYGFFGKYSLSLSASFKYSAHSRISKAQTRFGIELFAPVWDHSEIRLFAGSEKGGKVCRNGVCNYQAPFEGVRLEITTRF